MLPVSDKDVNSINGTTSAISSQETETNTLPRESEISRSSEQGGANGTNLLVGESYSGPTNLNNEDGEESWIDNILCSHVEGIKENPILWPAQSKF